MVILELSQISMTQLLPSQTLLDAPTFTTLRPMSTPHALDVGPFTTPGDTFREPWMLSLYHYLFRNNKRIPPQIDLTMTTQLCQTLWKRHASATIVSGVFRAISCSEVLRDLLRLCAKYS